MKKTVLFDVLLSAFLIFSLIAFGLQVKITDAYWSNVEMYHELIEGTGTTGAYYSMYLEGLNISYEYALSLTFSLIFCALSAVASAVLLILLNRGGFAGLKARMAQRKERVQANKASRAELRKTEKIAALEKELEELKKGGE